VTATAVPVVSVLSDLRSTGTSALSVGLHKEVGRLDELICSEHRAGKNWKDV